LSQEPSASELRTFIAEQLGEIAPYIADRFGRTGPLRFKSGREAITDVDIYVEDHLCRRILARFPDHGVQGEERGQSGSAPSAWQWHIDPVDGTLNYSLGIPMFSTALAVSFQESPVAGGVMDPLRRELFTAARGEGAFLGDGQISVSRRAELSRAIVSTQSSRQGLFVREKELLHLMQVEPMKTRRLGSIALELAYVAAGRFDLLLAGKQVPQNLYDVVAGLLLVEEAGGRVTDASGAPFQAGSVELIASNGLVHDEVLHLVRPFLRR
jgi:myo-inositol-1(or 4)-monophosphatase